MSKYINTIALLAISITLGSIAKSLSSLAEDTKDRKETLKVTMDTLNGFDASLKDLKDDPFGIKQKELDS